MVNDNDSTAEMSYQFLQAWLDDFGEYRDREFYITGESRGSG
jgi:hypothetical protein